MFAEADAANLGRYFPATQVVNRRLFCTVLRAQQTKSRSRLNNCHSKAAD